MRIPDHNPWKDPAFLEAWTRDKAHRDAIIRELFKKKPIEIARDSIQVEDEELCDRAARLEPGAKRSGKSASQARHQIPTMLAYDGGWIKHPVLDRAEPDKLEKSTDMYDHGLEKKAQRELACGLLGGEVHCRSGHTFLAAYRCGNRYCKTCAPLDGKKLFARQADRLLFVAQRLMLCNQKQQDHTDSWLKLHGEGEEDLCAECNKAIEEKRLPHWPPPREIRPRIVCAKIDFTLKHDASERTAKSVGLRMRELNGYIKKFCRAIEKRFRISRKEYGLAYCDELGGNNSNPHAHGIYVGPWLPQSKEHKELSELWREISGGSFILSIKFARNFSEALFHAIKYPAKFAQRSSPRRLAYLEIVFHRLRRFHTLASFYNPEAPKPEKPPAKRCPVCGDQLSEIWLWKTIWELRAKGLRELDEVAQDVARARGLGDRSPP